MFISDTVIESNEWWETTFKALSNLVCSSLSGIVDRFLFLQIIEKVCIKQIILKPALDNDCGITQNDLHVGL
ncbi:hypothetical protein Bca4012_010555 [Brassica carinata]